MFIHYNATLASAKFLITMKSLQIKVVSLRFIVSLGTVTLYVTLIVYYNKIIPWLLSVKPAIIPDALAGDRGARN